MCSMSFRIPFINWPQFNSLIPSSPHSTDSKRVDQSVASSLPPETSTDHQTCYPVSLSFDLRGDKVSNLVDCASVSIVRSRICVEEWGSAAPTKWPCSGRRNSHTPAQVPSSGNLLGKWSGRSTMGTQYISSREPLPKIYMQYRKQLP